MIEIAQNDYQTLVLLAENVSAGHPDIVKGNERGASGRRIGRFDRLGCDAGTSLDEEHSQALGSTAGNGEVVAEMSIRDPSTHMNNR
jgi:hypothetical protein